MAAPVRRWRATYTPGEWILLAGPTSVVVLQPASGKHSALIATLWEEILSSASIGELASRLAGYRIDSMPSFGAFFWTEGGMRSLVRGDVKVVDAATDSVVADGEGIQTWTEAGLDGVTQVRMSLPTVGATDPGVRAADPPLTLPLVIGAARASSVFLDGSPAAQIDSPQDQPNGSADEVEHDDESVSAGDGPIGDVEADDIADDDQEPEAEWADEVMTGPMTEPFPAPTPTPEPALAPAVGDGLPAMDPALLERIENGDTELMVPASTPDSRPDDLPNSMENGDTELMGPVPPQSAGSPAVSQDSMIMAVVCQYGHASPQNATVCRVCGTPIVPQGPQLVPRPPLALLRASNGLTESVDRVVLIGRAPAANASTARSPRLMTVLSPSHDISRTHLEVAPEGWQVVVTDLRSTNGTVLVHPGSGERTQLPSGEPVPVPLGSVLELGDGVSVLIDFPQ